MKERVRVLIGAIMLVILIAFTFVINYLLTRKDENNLIVSLNPELQRAMTYERFEDGDEDIEGTDNVKFSAFFLRDLDGDGYAEKIKGTCKEIGSQDTLYMEIIVQSEGYLENGKIEIDGKNFYLQTTLPKDNELKRDYISSNTKNIEFETLNNGTQKLMIGKIKSGSQYTIDEAIGNNINNYSRDDNKIILTGTYVDNNGNENEIRKEIEITTDWYGSVEAYARGGTSERRDLYSRINEEEGTFKAGFSISTGERKKQLKIYSSYLEGTIPELNGYPPISVRNVNNGGEYTYDEETRKFTITRYAIENEGIIESSISRDLNDTFEVIYPIEAYYAGEAEEARIEIPFMTYYKGYNNPNDEFSNPYTSNAATNTLRMVYLPPIQTDNSISISIGDITRIPTTHNYISKRKPLRIYNELSDKETNDNYEVIWRANIGTGASDSKLVFKETKDEETKKVDTFIRNDGTEFSMEDITTNIGIYFMYLNDSFTENFEIKVYDDDTDTLVHSFTEEEVRQYSRSRPYLYEYPVKHIRVETSKIGTGKYFTVYNTKQLDDDVIVDTYTREEFDRLKYIKSNLSVKINDDLFSTINSQVLYENPYARATISLSGKTMTTQLTQKNMKIWIRADQDYSENVDGWVNGTFLVKIPDEILDIKINNVTISNSNVNIDSYELVKNENGRFIKILTSNNNEQEYTITISVDITPDPRIASTEGEFNLYAKNEYCANYCNYSNDVYDIDSDGNITEKVNIDDESINLVSPNSLITTQTMSEYDDLGSMVIAPEIAELKPIYSEDDIEKQTVKVGIQFVNNYSGTIREVKVLGKIPFEGNSSVLSNIDLNSQFNTTMTGEGITIPDEIVGKVKIYYSEIENPTKDIDDVNNGWKEKEDVINWANIKTWLIDFKNEVIRIGEGYEFSYVVEIPLSATYNEISYSHHGIYFSLDTPEGKLKTQTEPNKIGVMIADKYNLVVTKYQKGKNKLIQGATYRISKLDDDGNYEESQTAVTNESGLLEMTNLYAERIYEIKEIQTPENYELNDDIVKIIGHIDRTTGTLTVELLNGSIKDNIEIEKNENENYKAKIKVEDETKASLKIIKKDRESGELLTGIRFRISGLDLPPSGRVIATNRDGEINISGIRIGEEYTIEEIRAEGYYLSNPLTFSINNDSGSYWVSLSEERDYEISEENDQPVFELTLENDKIPRFNLNIIKIKHETDNGGNQGTNELIYIPGAKFKIYRNGNDIGTYITDDQGKITIPDLYQYEEEKAIPQTYVLKELSAPEGYTKVQDIKFKVQKISGNLVFDEVISEGSSGKKYSVDGDNITVWIEDSPKFKMLKTDYETGELLPNTKFAIYNVENGTVPARNSRGEIIGEKQTIDGIDYYVVETNNNGEVTADLPEGLYKAIEVKANDDKYELRGQEYYFGIGRSINSGATLEFEPKLKPENVSGGTINDVLETEDGGYIAVGSFSTSTIDLGNDIILNKTDYTGAGMIIKYNRDFECEWAETVGTKANSIEVMADGGYEVGGEFRYSISFNDGAISFRSNSVDGVFLKFRINEQENGIDVEWAKQVGGTESDSVSSIYITPNEDIIIGVNSSSGRIDLGDNVIVNKDTSADGIIAKYEVDANNVEAKWANVISGTGTDYVCTISKNTNDNFIIGGYFSSDTIQLNDDITFNIVGRTTGYILECNEDGEYIDYKVFGFATQEHIETILKVSDNEIIIGGDYSRYLSDGKNLLLKSAGTDGFLIKYDISDGEYTPILAYTTGKKNSDYITKIRKRANGEYLVCGRYLDGAINFVRESEDLSHKINVDYANSIYGVNSESIYKVVEEDDGSYIFIGTIQGTAEFKGTQLQSVGGRDAYMIKCNSDGEVEWYKTIGGNDYDCITDIVKTTDGGYLIGLAFNSYSINLGNNISITRLARVGLTGAVVKLDQRGNAEWGRVYKNGFSSSFVQSVMETKNGDYLVAGTADARTTYLNITIPSTSDSTKTFLSKISNNGELLWTNIVADGPRINIIEESDNEIVTTIGNNIKVFKKLNDGVELVKEVNEKLNKAKDGGYYKFDDNLVTKYNKNFEVEWSKRIEIFGTYKGDTSDGGLLFAGTYSDNITFEDGTELKRVSNNYKCDAAVVKYKVDADRYAVDWIIPYEGYEGQSWQYTETISIGNAMETKDGKVLITGSFYGSLKFDNTYSITSAGQGSTLVTDPFIEKVTIRKPAEDLSILEIANKRKEFTISTDIKEIDNVKGGTISGEDEEKYEIVKYGDNSTNEIKMIPNDDYEIISITINDKDYPFEVEADGSFTMPQLENVTEDKHIEVTFALKNNKITINKVDKNTGNNINQKGIKFKLDQVEERSEPENSLGSLTDNGRSYYYANETKEVTGVFGTLTNNGTYYFVEQEDGEGNISYIPTNSKTWQVENVEGATSGKSSTTAQSYIPIDLTELDGKYKVVVNAEASSQSSDWGFARITETTEAMSYSNTTGRFMYISGETEAKDYESSIVLEGGNIYYLHLGYYKNSSEDEGEDLIRINSIKIYEAEEKVFSFEEVDGKYESTNTGYDSSVCNSYIPLDLTDNPGKYYLTVDVWVRSESNDYGYITLSESTDRVEYNTTTGVTRIINTAGNYASSQERTVEIDGGKQYYLHLGYYKNGNTSYSDDKFTVNSITLRTSDSELYHTTVETNSAGKIITQIPFGKYAVTEIDAPEGYYLNDTIPDIEFRSDDGSPHEFTIEDEKIDHVIVHHYVKGSTDKVSEDQIINGHEGEEYTTSPIIDLTRYRLEKINDEYVLPDNRTGEYTYNDIEVMYYYVPREIPLVVHHYLEGTNSGVPLIDGTRAEDVITEGNENDAYTTEAINSNLLNPKYELVEVPENSIGTLEYDQVIVTYNYRVKDSLGYIVHHVNIENGEKIAEDEIVSGGKYGDSYTTSPSSNIPPNYTYDSKTDNWEGTLVDTLTEITYYYKATTELKTLDVSKTSTTTLVNDKNQAIDYKITYLGSIDEYIGKAKVRIVDNLPYEIDESLSNLDGGIYDETNKTITWEENYVGINTYEDGIYNINLIKNIRVVFKNIDLTAEEIANNIDGYLITYDGNTEHERLDTDSLEVPQEIKGKVIVKYIDKKTNEEISEEVVHSARIGTEFDISSDVKTIDDYELVEEPQEKTGVYTEADQEKTYKYAKKIDYTIEYYYDNIKDETKTETKNDSEDTVISTYTEKVIDGYKLDKTENLPLTLDRDGNNVIKVYYKKDIFAYTVEYYYDGVIDESKTEVASAEFGSVINSYNRKVIDGYKLHDEENLPLTITSNSDNNVIKVYYVKDDYEYTIEYYYDGVKDDTLTETDEAEFGSKIEDYIDKVKTGYILSKTENLPLIITSNPDENIIKIYYIPDDGQTKEIFYNIEYYKDEQLVVEDTKKITNTVQLLDPDTLEVNIVEVYEQDKYPGYEIDRTEPESIPDTINSGSAIKVFYKKRNDITYQILFKEKGTGRVIAESEGGTGTYQETIRAEDFIIDIHGYIYDSCDKDEIELSAIDDENVITLYYRKKNDLSYTVNYLDKDTNEELKTAKVVNNQTYLDEILSEDEVVDINGYEYDSSNVDTLIISEDISLNTINLYYTKRNDLSYTVKYVDKDTNKEITERKIVNNKTYGEVVDTTNEIIEIEKYNYNSISNDSITIGTNNNEIIVYYIKKEGDITVRFIDQLSGEEIEQRVTATEKVDTEYKIEEKEINGYVYVESSGNKEGVFTETPQEVILYYRKAAKVIVRYVDKVTNEEIDNSKVISGFIGKEYNLEDKGKEIVGYRYSDRTENISGEMTEEDIEVIYYYKKESKVIVKYINDYTNEVIGQEEETYIEGDSYRTNPKKIEGYDIDITREYDNSSGIVGREDIEVKYYYKEKATLVIEYVDEKGNKIVNDKEIDVHTGESYEVDKILIDGYNFRGMPDNYKGTIENKRTVVRLVYDKIYSDDSKADTTIPQTMDKNIRKGLTISGMIAVLIYSIVVIIRWKISENKNK